MKIESAQFYRFGTFMPCAFDYEKEFLSLHEIVTFYCKMCQDDSDSVMLWLDNWRFMLIRKNSCDIHYHYDISPLNN